MKSVTSQQHPSLLRPAGAAGRRFRGGREPGRRRHHPALRPPVHLAPAGARSQALDLLDSHMLHDIGLSRAGCGA